MLGFLTYALATLISDQAWAALFAVSFTVTMLTIAVFLLSMVWSDIEVAYRHCCNYVKNQGWQQDTLPVNDHDTDMTPTQNPEVAASLDAPVSTHNIKSSTNSVSNDDEQDNNLPDLSDSDHDSQVTQH